MTRCSILTSIAAASVLGGCSSDGRRAADGNALDASTDSGLDAFTMGLPDSTAPLPDAVTRSCDGPSECTPGAEDSVPCGVCNMGERGRICNSTCRWAELLECVEHATCDPSADPATGRCPTGCGTRFCESRCAWGACSDGSREVEQNDWTHPTWVCNGSSIGGSLDAIATDDADHYVIDLTAGQTVRMSVAQEPCTPSVAVSLLVRPPGSTDWIGGAASCPMQDLRATSSGPHLIQLWSNADTRPVRYRLNIAVF